MAVKDWMRTCLRKVTTTEQRYALWKKLCRVQDLWLRVFGSGNLRWMATLYNSDKWGRHYYAPHYERHFASLRRKRVTLLEIGIGGYHFLEAGGGSLRMWRSYFRRGRIHGLDIHEKKSHDEARITTHVGDQGDPEFLRALAAKIGPLHIVIDDGSHQMHHIRTSFETLFPLLEDGGVYVIEDLQTAYWPEFGGAYEKRNSPETTMGLLKDLADGLNYEEFKIPGYTPTYFDRNIKSVHLYHNIAFIFKGANAENQASARGGAHPDHPPKNQP